MHQGSGRRKSAAYMEYVSILRRSVTQLLSVRRIFEIGCKWIHNPCQALFNFFLLDIFTAALYGKYNEFHANNQF